MTKPPINSDDILAELSPERRAEVLERGRQLIAEEHAALRGVMMDVRPIRTEADYDWSLEQVETYFDNEPELGTPEADRFDVLCTLIGVYEAEHYPIRDIGLFERIVSWVRKRFSQNAAIIWTSSSKVSLKKPASRN